MRRFHSGMLMLRGTKPKNFPMRGKWFVLDTVNSDPGNYDRKLSPAENHKRLREVGYPKEIVIEAKTEEAAHRANDLLWGSLTLIHGGQFWMDLDDLEHTLLAAEAAKVNPMPPNRGILQTTQIQEACEISVKASFRKSFQYAIAKFLFSAALSTVPIVDLDPSHATHIFPKFSRPLHQVQAGTVIVLCYGIIEELGFEVKSNAQKPSALEDGTWNPLVKQDLEARLEKAGINIAEQVNWQIRGQKTKLEAEKPRQIHHTSKPSPWAYWTVRDRMVDIVDAIAHLSWLRSNVSSHRIHAKRARLLSLYDTTNAQFLARQLILEALGFWKGDDGGGGED